MISVIVSTYRKNSTTTTATGYLGNSNSRCRFHHSHKKWKDLHSRSLSVSYDYDTVLTYFTSSFLWLWYCVDIFHIKFLMTMILCWHILHQVSYGYDTVLTYFTSSFLCLWYCVDIFHIKFRSCETFTVTNSGAILLLIETLSDFRAIKCWFILYLQMYVLG